MHNKTDFMIAENIVANVVSHQTQIRISFADNRIIL